MYYMEYIIRNNQEEALQLNFEGKSLTDTLNEDYGYIYDSMKSKWLWGFRIIQNLYINKDNLSFILNLKQKIYQKIIFFGNLIIIFVLMSIVY